LISKAIKPLLLTLPPQDGLEVVRRKTSIQDIASTLEKQSGEVVSDDLVWLAIDQLNESNLLESKAAPKFAGQSRREVIKKIGLASMVAIPVVASLVAPNAALASVSCTCAGNGNGVFCASNPGCGSTCCSANTGTCQNEANPANLPIVLARVKAIIKKSGEGVMSFATLYFL
jgi:hypothetical protein